MPDQARGVDQDHRPQPFPVGPAQVGFEGAMAEPDVDVQRQDGAVPPGRVTAETAAGQDAAGEAVLERIVDLLGVAAAAVGEGQDFFCRHRFRSEAVRPLAAGRRDVGQQRPNAVGRVAVTGGDPRWPSLRAIRAGAFARQCSEGSRAPCEGASPVWQSSIHATDLRSFLELLSFWGVFHVLTIAFHAASKRLDATRARMLNTACPPFFPQRCPERFNR